MERGTGPTRAAPEGAVDGKGDGAAAPGLEVHDPADGSVIASVPIDGPAEVRAAAERARAAQPAWEALGHAGRYELLGRWRDWMLANGDAIAGVLERESGKVRQDASLETPGLADAINYYGANSARMLAD